MSEVRTSFMAELDQWSQEEVIKPLLDMFPRVAGETVYDEDLPYAPEQVLADVKKAIRAKVLESYRNGQSAGPRKAIPAKRRPYGV